MLLKHLNIFAFLIDFHEFLVPELIKYADMIGDGEMYCYNAGARIWH